MTRNMNEVEIKSIKKFIFLLPRSIILFSWAIHYLHNFTDFCIKRVYVSDEEMEMNFSLIYKEKVEK